MCNNTAVVLTVIGFEMAQGFPQAVRGEKKKKAVRCCRNVIQMKMLAWFFMANIVNQNFEKKKKNS